MKSFDIKTKIYFGDQALDRLAEIHTGKCSLSQILS